MLLSPLDWALIESWQERGVPLKIVLRAIENVFDGVDKNPHRQRTIKSLTYCREEIETQYAEWLESQVGKSGEIVEKENPKPRNEAKKSTLFSDEAIENHLENVGKLIDATQAKTSGKLKNVLAMVTEKLSEHKNLKLEAEELEESLNHLEELIDKTLLEIADKKLLAKLKLDVEKELAKYKSKMEVDVYQRTYDLMILKNLREKAEIPRISLFYL